MRRSSRRTDRSSPIDANTVLSWLAAASLVSAPFWLGGATPATAAVVAGTTTLAMCLAVWLGRQTLRLPPAPLTWLAVAVAWTALQVLPLPIGFVELLAPTAADHARSTAQLLGDVAPRVAVLSEDPGRTGAAFVTAVMVLTASIAAALLVRARRRRIVFRALVFVALGLALIAVGHALLDAHSLFGLYVPRYARPSMMSPLLNDNHLAAILAASTPLAVALGRGASDRGRRTSWYAIAGLCGTIAIATRSRSAIPTLLIGLGIQLVATRLHREEKRRDLVVPAVAVLLAALGAAAYVGADRLLEALGDHDVSKLDVARRGLALLDDAPWVGVGRGAFTVAFVRIYGVSLRFEQPENWLVLWLGEWGLVFGVILAVGLAGALFRVLFRQTSASRAAAAAALVALVAHDFVDFALELPGVAVYSAVLFGLAVTPAHEGSAPVASRRTLAVIVSALGLALVVAAAGIIRLPRDSSVAQEEMLTLALAAPTTEDIGPELARAIRLHPGEPNLALLGATYQVRRLHRDSPLWLNRAMRLAPNWPGPHILAARWLRSRGRHAQARVELREAARREPASVRGVLCEMLGPTPDIELISRTAPPGAHRIPTLEIAAGCVGLWTPAGRAIDAKILALDPADPGAARREARRLELDGRLDDAERIARRAIGRHADDYHLGAQLVHVLLTARRADAADAVISRLEAARMPDPRVAALRATVAQARGDVDAMRSATEEMRGLAAGSTEGVADSYRLLATLETKSGNRFMALRALEEAYRLTAARPDLDAILRAARAAGDLRRASSALRELCALDGPGAPSCREVEAPRSGAPP